VQQRAAQSLWFHILTLITKEDTHALRDWYARETVRQSWERDSLLLRIHSQ
jgi:hypothetical protein